jgi:hypothetical protein
MAQSPSLSPFIPSPPSPSITISSLSLSDPFEKGASGLPPPPPTAYSPHYVISITDILGALGRAYVVNQEVLPGVDSSQVGSRNEGSALTSSLRQSGESGIGAGGGLESWKWAKEQGQEAALGQTIA